MHVASKCSPTPISKVHLYNCFLKETSPSLKEKYREIKNKIKMRTKFTLVFAAFIVIVHCTNLALCWEETKVIHVGGKVLCQDCTQGWNDWVNGDKPIKGTTYPLTPSILPLNYRRESVDLVLKF